MQRKRFNRIAVLMGSGAMAWGTQVVPAAVTITTVPVGNAGNAADSTSYGAVAYNYNIGKYEVTAGQYTAFLNAVAQTDTFALYNTQMQRTDFGSGISRGSNALGFTYTVDAAFVNRPVNFVSFWDAARFANWMVNGQPTGAQGAGTTETGAYTLTDAGITSNTISRNAGASWAITSEDEWYKAAYYKGGSTSAGYWSYATQSNTRPGNNLADPAGNNANSDATLSGFFSPPDGTHDTTVGGQYANSASAYGTFDQNGNVFEWTESVVGVNHVDRGGSFGGAFFDRLVSSSRVNDPTTGEFDNVGFRLTQFPGQVPEPSSLMLLSAGVLAITRRKRTAR